MKNKVYLFTTITIFALLSAGLVYYFLQKDNRKTKAYKVNQPIVTNIVNKTVATGSIKPWKEVPIKPQLSGVIEELYVETGTVVRKNQKLAKIKLVPSQVNINNAESTVKLAELKLENAKRELAKQASIFEQQLDVDNANAKYESAKREEARNRQLFEEGIISEQELDKYVLDKDLRKVEYENAKLTSNYSLRNYEVEVDIRRQELDAAVNNLQLLQEGRSQRSSQVANVVTSTVDGMILDIPVEVGSSVIERNNFNEGTTIATVADMKSLIFEGKVDESDVGKLKVGIPLELTVGAIENRTFSAVLEYIAPKGEDDNGTIKFPIKAIIDTPEDVFLRAGYSASADIILAKKEQVWAIKERDLIFQNDSTYVEVKVNSQQFTKKLVELGLSDGINVEVLEGVDSSAQIKVQRIF